MYTLTVERQDGEKLTLTQYRSAYQVTYTGLGPVAAEIITSSLGMVDGDKYNGARVGARNVVLSIAINNNAEANRIRLYGFLAPKSWVKLHYQNGTRRVYVEGYVESFDIDQFRTPQTAQVSIICPQAYLTSAEELVVDITSVVDAFEFPFSSPADGFEFSAFINMDYANMHNSGDVSTGLIVTAFAQSEVTAPTIYNVLTNEYIKINGTLYAGDTLTINTNTGQKRIQITDAQGNTVNILHRLVRGSTWLQVKPGDNYISYSADEGEENMLVSLRHSDLFVGV